MVFSCVKPRMAELSFEAVSLRNLGKFDDSVLDPAAARLRLHRAETAGRVQL